MKTIEAVLEQLNLQIQHLRTPRLRAESLSRLLEVEKSNLRFLDGKKALSGAVEMVRAINQIETLEHIDFSIAVLKHYIATSSFDILVFSRPTKDARLTKIKEMISRIVEIEMEESAFIQL